MTVHLLIGDVFARLAQLEADSVDCVVTSPPYWGLRDYDVDGQIGLEPTLGEHLDVMVNVFAEIWRVLKPEGTVWLNYGDCYATKPNGRSAAATKALGNDDRTFRDKPFSTIGPIDRGKCIKTRWGGRVISRGRLKPKDLCMVANRLAIALQDSGWWVRSEIIWLKANAMPESIKDRPGQCHEKLFLLTKSQRYFYNAEAVKQTSQNGQSNSKNMRTVWSVLAQPYPDAHFATFPPAIVEPCIKAGCPPGGLVLDPFAGAGTVGLVAEQLQRDSILIEIKPDYAEMIERRIRLEAGTVCKINIPEAPL